MRTLRSIAAGLCGLALIAGSASAAENLLKGGDGEDPVLTGKWHVGARQNLTDKKSGNASMEVAVRDWIYSPEMIEVDLSKTYKLSGFFKTADGKPATVLFGARFYTADKKEIGPLSVLPMPGTETTLAAAAKKGDTALKIASTTWTLRPPFLYGVAFNAKDDLSDLPNNDTALITKVDGGKASGELILKEELTADYPAGVKVRMQRYFDYVVANVKVSGEWQEISMTFSGEALRGAPVEGKFWNGTKYMRVHAGLNSDRKPDDCARILIDDVTIVVVEK